MPFALDGTPYGERRIRIGSGLLAFAGVMMTVSSLMPSRTGIITCWYVNAGVCATALCSVRSANANPEIRTRESEI